MNVCEKAEALLLIEEARKINRTLLEDLVFNYKYKVACDIITQYNKQQSLKQKSKSLSITNSNIDDVTDLWEVEAIGFVTEASKYNERVSSEEVLDFLKSKKLIPKDVSEKGMKVKLGRFFNKAGFQKYRFWYKKTNTTLYWVE